MLEQQICVVTGATGFVAQELIVQLLNMGFPVRGTVRSPDSLPKVAALGKLAEAMQGQLSFHPADLSEPGGFDAVVEGAKYVFHVASPVMLTSEDHQRDIVDPAVHGTRNMMNSVAKAGTVKRVVLTSSIVALPQPSGSDYVTSEDWKTDATLEKDPYSLSKVLAEKEAWDLAKKHNLDLVAILPGLVFGSVYDKSLVSSFSVQNMTGLIEGRQSLFAPTLIDVADVAKAHIHAALRPQAHGRYILCNEQYIPATEVAAIMSQAFPEYSIGPPSPASEPTGRYCDTNRQLKEDLGMSLTPPEVFLPTMVRCLVRLGIAKPTAK